MFFAGPLGTTEVLECDTPEEEPTVIVSSVYNGGGALLSRELDWPQPLKHLSSPSRGLSVTVRSAEEVVIRVAKPVKGLFFTNDGVRWSDNCLDLVPGDETVIKAEGLKDPPEWMYYGQED